MDRQGSIVSLNNYLKYLGRWKNLECEHHPIWKFFSDFRNQKSSHARSCASSQRVAYLESCKEFGEKIVGVVSWKMTETLKHQP